MQSKPDGGGDCAIPKSICVTPAERTEITKSLAKSLGDLKSKQRLPPREAAPIKFEWPLRAAGNLNWNN